LSAGATRRGVHPAVIKITIRSHPELQGADRGFAENHEEISMRKIALSLLALAGAAFAMPATAQPWHGHHHGWRHNHGPSFGIYFGAPGPVYGRAYCKRERIVRVRPNGTRVVRWVRRCY
jgi:hypothetical protein